jgi:mannitol-1-/sugar-/sorbitol-6-phosphatase
MSDRTAALLLDLDGTLVDSEHFHRQVFRNWFAARGWPLSDELLRAFTGRRADDVLARTPGPWAGEDIAGMQAELLAEIARLPRPELAPGASDLLTGAGVRLALVTSANTQWATKCLGTLLDRFDVVVTRDDVTRGKPHPEPYGLACRTLGVPAQACVAVEDAPAGVASAVAAGVGLVVGILGTFDADALVDAHVLVSSLSEISALL